MKLTRFERMTLWMSALLESHALPLRHSSWSQMMSLIRLDVLFGRTHNIIVWCYKGATTLHATIVGLQLSPE
jgi:hypothetical protein